jgi:pimeloyl-ACP methyl ester carboxylesterase
VLAGAGCSHPASPISSVGTTAPSSPAPIDAAGQPIVRPSCAEPGDGRYLHATGSTGLTPVLLLGTGPRGVVVGAQANGDICQLLPYGRVLAGKGYHVAVFDWTQPYAEAMATAAQALLADGAAKVVLGGFSRGALVGLGIAPTLGPQVVGVFSVSGGPSAVEGFPTVASLSAYRGPILLVSSVDDAVFPSGTSAAIAAAHAGAETVLLVPGSAHALALLSDPEGGRVQAAIDRFLAQALP